MSIELPCCNRINIHAPDCEVGRAEGEARLRAAGYQRKRPPKVLPKLNMTVDVAEIERAAYERGRADERADAVALGRQWGDVEAFVTTLERGEHRGASKRQPSTLTPPTPTVGTCEEVDFAGRPVVACGNALPCPVHGAPEKDPG